mmetsp:Transcript_107471/g.342589  ORF Transcript_107471/g.342589 Transcript_107471/m.342589 type:complete len:201 (+) Transcript_107471:1706-2308(+)
MRHQVPGSMSWHGASGDRWPWLTQHRACHFGCRAAKFRHAQPRAPFCAPAAWATLCATSSRGGLWCSVQISQPLRCRLIELHHFLVSAFTVRAAAPQSGMCTETQLESRSKHDKQLRSRGHRLRCCTRLGSLPNSAPRTCPSLNPLRCWPIDGLVLTAQSRSPCHRLESMPSSRCWSLNQTATHAPSSCRINEWSRTTVT